MQRRFGNRTGIDPASGTLVQDIPQSAYFADGQDDPDTGQPLTGNDTHSVQVFQPASGVYSIIVRGLNAGPSSLTIAPFSTSGASQQGATMSVDVPPGSLITYQLKYDSTGATPPTLITPDVTPPKTSVAMSPHPNAAGWNDTNVTVTLNSTDSEPGGTGVKQIQWSLTGAQTGSSMVSGSTATLTISAEGATTLTYFGTDNAGNQEAPKTLSIQVDKTPPTVIASPNPTTLWPPNGKMVPVMISGTIADNLSGVNPSTASFSVKDSYGLVQPSGPVSLAENGAYSFPVLLEARRDGQDMNGRLYTAMVNAQDNAGNVGATTTTVMVPHDQ
jgi:hypothetical protein